MVAWPDWGHLRYFAILGAVQSIWFWIIYAGADYLTEQRALRVRVHFSAELAIPFQPQWVVVYMSIYLLFLAAPFILRTRQELRGLTVSLAAVIFCAGVGFLLIPAESAFPPYQILGRFSALFKFADSLNLHYNMLPSLHVALAVGCVAAFSTRAGACGKSAFWIWAIAISVSTVFTHQHHILDVVSGFVLAAIAHVAIFRRLANANSTVIGR